MGIRAGKRILLAGVLVLIGVIGYAPVVAQEVTPTVGDIVVDSFDCDTGVINFHVPVTDLPRAPADVNPSLGYSATASYEQGSSGFFTHGFDPAAEDSPYTGDVALSLTIPLDGAEAMEEASGPLQSIDISVTVGTSDGSGPTDTSRTTYQVECGEHGDDSSEAGSGDSDAADGQDDDTNETVQLPGTGTGAGDSGSLNDALFIVLSVAAIVLGATGLRLRRQG